MGASLYLSEMPNLLQEILTYDLISRIGVEDVS